MSGKGHRFLPTNSLLPHQCLGSPCNSLTGLVMPSQSAFCCDLCGQYVHVGCVGQVVDECTALSQPRSSGPLAKIPKDAPIAALRSSSTEAAVQVVPAGSLQGAAAAAAAAVAANRTPETVSRLRNPLPTGAYIAVDIGSDAGAPPEIRRMANEGPVTRYVELKAGTLRVSPSEGSAVLIVPAVPLQGATVVDISTTSRMPPAFDIVPREGHMRLRLEFSTPSDKQTWFQAVRTLASGDREEWKSGRGTQPAFEDEVSMTKSQKWMMVRDPGSVKGGLTSLAKLHSSSHESESFMERMADDFFIVSEYSDSFDMGQAQTVTLNVLDVPRMREVAAEERQSGFPVDLSGFGLPSLAYDNFEDLQGFRLFMRAKLRDWVRRDTARYVEAATTDSPLPDLFPPLFRVHVRMGGFRDEMTECPPSQTVVSLVQVFLLSYKSVVSRTQSFLVVHPNDYTVRLGGERVYVADTSVPLSALTYIRECIRRDRVPELEIVEKPGPLRSMPQKLSFRSHSAGLKPSSQAASSSTQLASSSSSGWTQPPPPSSAHQGLQSKSTSGGGGGSGTAQPLARPGMSYGEEFTTLWTQLTKKTTCYDGRTVHKPFEVSVMRLSNFSMQILPPRAQKFARDYCAPPGAGTLEREERPSYLSFYVAVRVVYGTRTVEEVYSDAATLQAASVVVWNQPMVRFRTAVAEFAPETVLSVSVVVEPVYRAAPSLLDYVWKPEHFRETVALASMPLADARGLMRRGSVFLPLWPSSVRAPDGTTDAWTDLNLGVDALLLEFHLDSPEFPIRLGGSADESSLLFPSESPSSSYASMQTSSSESGAPSPTQEAAASPVPSRYELELLKQTLQQQLDPVHADTGQLDDEEGRRVWRFREVVRTQYPESLPVLLRAVRWREDSEVRVIHAMLAQWPWVSPLAALQLLDAQFPDTRVRSFAVHSLQRRREAAIGLLPQLVQVLKWEVWLGNPLIDFLLWLALQSMLAAHRLFWLLWSERRDVRSGYRVKIYLEAYLRGVMDFQRLEFLSELAFVERLQSVAAQVQQSGAPALADSLARLSFAPQRFCLPINPSFEVSGLVVERCRVMQSNARPLWLVFQSAEGAQTNVIYKRGDDLRSDVLVLQAIRLMDQLWQARGLDLHMLLYDIVVLDDSCGMIEVVSESRTTGDIQRMAAGGSNWGGVLQPDAILSFLRMHNPASEDLERAVRNFTYSCAGYAVCTYILGVGDRHNDNIMVTTRGSMFHIDFGYFLGQKMEVLGVFSRETTPFVLTHQYAHVMGGTQSTGFQTFMDLCVRAFNIVRKDAPLLLALFRAMLSSGVPQLRAASDLDYLRSTLMLGDSDEVAASKFRQLIFEALSNKRVLFDHIMHSWSQRWKL